MSVLNRIEAKQAIKGGAIISHKDIKDNHYYAIGLRVYSKDGYFCLLSSFMNIKSGDKFDYNWFVKIRYRYNALNELGLHEPYSGFFNTVKDAKTWFNKYGIRHVKKGRNLKFVKIKTSFNNQSIRNTKGINGSNK